MEERYIKAIDPNKWIRPAGWLQMPNITSADNKIAILHAVYDNKENTFALNQGQGTCNWNIDWGDGTNNNYNGTGVQQKSYVYSATTSPILVDEWGENYKQVLIVITYISGPLTGNWSFSTTAAVRLGTPQLLEIVFSWNSLFTSNRYMPLLKSINIVKGISNGSALSYFSFFPALDNLNLDNIVTNTNTTSQAFLSNSGNISLGNLNWNTTGIITSFFSGSNIRKIGDLNCPTTTQMGSMFLNCFNLTEIGDINCPLSTNFSVAFQSCKELISIGDITLSPGLTTLSATFQFCYKLRRIVFLSDLSSLTTVSSAFNNCQSLEYVRLPNLILSVVLSNFNLERPAIIDLFNDLGTPGTTRIINISGNPGVPDLTAADLLIATSKNWTVTL